MGYKGVFITWTCFHDGQLFAHIFSVFETAKANDTYATLTVPTTTAATTTAKPSISLQAVTTYTTVRFSVIATFSTQIGRFTESVLSAHLKQDLADQTGITVELIVNFVITEGMTLITSVDLYELRHQKTGLRGF